MAQNVNPTFVKTPNFSATQITTGTGASITTVYIGGANGSKVNALFAVANTTGTFDVRWGIAVGGVAYIHSTVSVPNGAGVASATPSVNLLSNSNVPLATDSDGNPYVFLASSAYSLFAQATAGTSLWAAGSFINVIAPSVGDF